MRLPQPSRSCTAARPPVRRGRSSKVAPTLARPDMQTRETTNIIHELGELGDVLLYPQDLLVPFLHLAVCDPGLPPTDVL
jgi:hypothetical protein